MAERLEYVSPAELAAIADPVERLAAVVRQLFALFEQVLGQAWTGYVLEGESPVLAAAMAETDGLARMIADVLFEDEAPPDGLRCFVYGLLHPLTYRALRVKQGLSADERWTTWCYVGRLLDIARPARKHRSLPENRPRPETAGIGDGLIDETEYVLHTEIIRPIVDLP